MDISELGVFTIRVDLADAFEDEDAVKAKYLDTWIELREPTADEVLKGQKDNDFMMRNIPNLIIGHNISKGSDKASNKEVGEIIKKSSTIYTHVTRVWGESLPLARRSDEMSETPLDVSSEDNES